MSDYINRFDHLLQKVEHFLMLVAGVLTFMVMFLVTVDIVMKNVINRPLSGVYEMVVYVFIALGSFGLAYVQGQKGNIIVEVATESCSERVKNMLDLLGCLIGLGVIAIIAFKTTQNTITSFVLGEYQSFTLLKLPVWPAKGFVALGMTLLSIRLLIDCLQLILKIAFIRDQQENKYPNIEA